MKLRHSSLLITFLAGLILTCGGLTGNAQAGQPHMVNALATLRAARHQLEMAEANKSGHRLKAIADIDEAIAEVQAGMADAN